MSKVKLTANFVVSSPPDIGVEADKLHKQPRALLKTVGRGISNTTGSPGLFTPQPIEPGGGILEVLKEEISKNTGALAFLLMQMYQENNRKPLDIRNLAPLAEKMNCNNYRLKLYLQHLGGYVYPILDRDEVTKELVLTNDFLFKIEFRYSEKIAEKYPVSYTGDTVVIQGVERIGNSLLNFIKDEPVARVIIAPSERLIRALDGKGLGNILTTNKFISLMLEVTDMAAKIFTYSSSNSDDHKIAEDNLVKHLGLTKQVKTQGRPRVRATILGGLKELQNKGHIKSYSYNEITKVYSYTYSDKYVRWRPSKKDRLEPPEGVR